VPFDGDAGLILVENFTGRELANPNQHRLICPNEDGKS